MSLNRHKHVKLMFSMSYNMFCLSLYRLAFSLVST